MNIASFILEGGASWGAEGGTGGQHWQVGQLMDNGHPPSGHYLPPTFG